MSDTVIETTAAEQPDDVSRETVAEKPDVVAAPVPAVVQHRDSALEAAAEAALAMPGLPGRDEFLMLAVQARMLSLSSGAPKAVRNNPHLAFHMAMVGRDLGISPSASIELIDVIAKSADDPDARLSLSPQLLNGQIRRLGLGSIRPVERTNAYCVARALGPQGEVLGESEFTWEDAQIAGLVDGRCPDALNHFAKNGDRCKCRQGWRTYPKRMLWWRAAGYAADDFFPEAGLGLYSPEELGSVVDAEGRPIDPSAVELPEGYEPAPRAIPAAQKAAPTGQLWELQERIAALPQQQRDDLKERWQSSDRLRGRRVSALAQGVVGLATSMVTGFEKLAAKDGWDADEALAAVRAKVAAQFLALFGFGDGVEVGSPTDAPDPAPVVAQDGPGDGAAASDTPGTEGPPAANEGPVEANPGEPPPELVAEVIKQVQGMAPDEVHGELAVRELATGGAVAAKRRRLAEAMIRERHRG